MCVALHVYLCMVVCVSKLTTISVFESWTREWRVSTSLCFIGLSVNCVCCAKLKRRRITKKREKSRKIEREERNIFAV